MKRSRIRPKRKQPSAKWELISPGVWRIEDPHHPRGYRIRRSPEMMTLLTWDKVAEQNFVCSYCGLLILLADATPDHIRIRGMGGAWRDDHEDNIRALHVWCNTKRGSKPVTKREARGE